MYIVVGEREPVQHLLRLLEHPCLAAFFNLRRPAWAVVPEQLTGSGARYLLQGHVFNAVFILANEPLLFPMLIW